MNDEIMIKIPQGFQKIESLPGDPPESVAYGKQTESSICFVMMYPISTQRAMPYGNEKEVIDGIHGVLADDQGLVEVKSGLTVGQKKYVYSIVKSRLQPTGMEYIMTMHIDMNDKCMNIQGNFGEKGMTGFRDSTIMNKMMLEGKVNPLDMSGWVKDPYDENYKKGALMNESEKSEYDESFPHHPLSEARAIIKYIIENN